MIRAAQECCVGHSYAPFLLDCSLVQTQAAYVRTCSNIKQARPTDWV